MRVDVPRRRSQVLETGGGDRVRERRSGEDNRTTVARASAEVIAPLIAAVVLFNFGTGPIKGFAVTLSIGILTSMFTAIMVTRGLVNLLYGGKQVKRLAI